MNMRSVKILLLLTVLSPFFLKGQTDPYGQVTIASPNAASLGKYADIPVSYHTGIPQISVPIYDIKAGPISMPIGLSYHASGLKVQETASWVGAGWSLDAGGVITRTVMGLPDEKGTSSGGVDGYGYYTDSGYNKYLYFNVDQDWQGFAQGRKDGEPDLFFFNFGGYSGKFFFRDDHTAVLVPQQDVKIIPYFPNPGTKSIQGFTIITPDGTKYYFGNTPGVTGTPPIEITNPYSVQGGYVSGTAISSWYLNRVTSFDSAFSVTLSYAPENYGYFMVSSNSWDPDVNVTGYSELFFVKNLIQGVRLSQINFSNGSVTFNPGLYRKDLSDNSQSTFDNTNNSAMALSSITIQNGNTVSGLKNAFCKTFKLYTSYFTDSVTALPSAFTMAGQNFFTDKYRLRLDSIREMSCDNLLQIPARRFTYFPELTPRRMNLGTDHWGFYNGVTTNQTMYPTYTTNDGTTINTFTGANRNASWPAMRGGSLYQMTYPTGGSTTFDFEPADSYTLSSSSQQVGQIGTNYVLNIYGQNVFTQTSPFTSNGTTITINATNYSNYAATFTIYNSSGANIYSTNIANNNYPGSQTTSFAIPISIPAGNYTATMTLSTNATNGIVGNLSQILTVITNTPVVIGGLRIKTITQKDSINNVTPVVTNYSYPSGGYLYSFPTYVTHLRNDIVAALGFYEVGSGFQYSLGSNNGCPLSGGYYIRSGNSQRPMSTTQGYHIGFPVVKVSQSGSGSSVYNYYTSNAGYGQQSLNPGIQNVNTPILTCEPWTPNYPPAPLAFDYRKGELYYEQHYNQAGQLLKDIYYYPQYDTSTLQAAPAFIVAVRNGLAGNANMFATEYKVSSPRRTSMHTIETNYTPGMGSVQQDTYTYYGSQYHNQVTRKVVSTSTGDSTVTNTLYTPDFHSAAWDLSPSCESSYTTNCSSCLTIYDTAISRCSGQPSICFSNAMLAYRQCLSNARNTYVNSRFANYTGVVAGSNTPQNNYATQHNLSRNAASTELKPILDLQDSNRVVPIEISDFRNSSLLKANFTRYDYMPGSTTIPYPNKTQLVSISAPSSSFTNAAISASTITKDSRYLDESTYAFQKGNPARVTAHDGLVTIYIWDYLNTSPIAKTIAPATDTTAFTSFEADGNGNWTVPSVIRDSINFLTGIMSYNLSSGSITKTGLTTGKQYTVSYWGRSGPYTITGGTTSSKTGRSVNGWTYYEIAITTTGSTITISGTGNIDELRLYPQGAQMSSYTYKPIVGITTMNDPNSEVTYYEYDNLERLKNIKDYQGNIIKNYQYNYVDPNACGANCMVVALQTFAATNTLSYPVGVFNVNGKLLGNATTQAQYITTWMADTADSHTGTIVAGSDSMHFKFTVNSGRAIPSGVTGCRYYQYDLTYNSLDGVTNFNGCYVDFGDGNKMRLGNSPNDTVGLILPINTTLTFANIALATIRSGRYPFFVHSYSDTTLKTITIYHNDGTEEPGLFASYTTESLRHLTNVRGYFPKNMQVYQTSYCIQPSAQTITNIYNWNIINGIVYFSSGFNYNFIQDFMRNNTNLQIINIAGSGSLSKLKSNWNVFFTGITSLELDNTNWNQEDISALVHLNNFELSDDTLSPLTPTILDNIFNQIAAGSAKFIQGGFCGFDTGNYATLRNTSASYTAVTFLRSQNWIFRIGEGAQPLP